MSKNFSFNSDLFAPILGISFFAHAGLLGIGNLWPATVSFSVTESVSSVEVSLVEEEVPQAIVEPEELEDSFVEIAEEKIELVKKIEEEKELSDDSPKGAITEILPLYRLNPAPVYPQVARRQGWEGTVLLKVLVGIQGNAEIINIEQSSSYEVLDKAALAAVRDWEFKPAQAGLMKFSSWVKIPIKFVLKNK